ncbi:MAG: membrane integrity-associated transporter subunit PqiC [Deltaproteobacteria bacterium]|nr:membrane integrity-associated transporter subunit PqiC [Deltaproteobacteria bacterium]
MTDRHPSLVPVLARRRARAATLGVALAVAATSSGCGLLSNFQAKPDPTRFFVLASATDATRVGTLDPSRTVGLGPIEIPNYLQRPELIVRESATELRPSTFDRWSEPLDKGLARVLAQNLSYQLGIDRVTLFPWYSNQEPTFQVRIDFLSFEPVASREVRVVARWDARRLGSPAATRVQRESVISLPIGSDDSASAVAVLSKALDELARDMASAVLTLDAAGPNGSTTPPATSPRR